MSEEKKVVPPKAGAAKAAQASQAKVPQQAASEGCKFEDCKKKSTQFGFCEEHYEMYMAGIIRGDGRKPTDYNEKLGHYLKHQQKRVA